MPGRRAPQPALAVIVRPDACVSDAPMSNAPGSTAGTVVTDGSEPVACFKFHQCGRHYGADHAVMHDDAVDGRIATAWQVPSSRSRSAQCATSSRRTLTRARRWCSVIHWQSPGHSQACCWWSNRVRPRAYSARSDDQIRRRSMSSSRSQGGEAGHRRHDAHAVQRPSGHAGEANVQRQSPA